MESFLLGASIVLLVMGAIALGLAFIFRSRRKRLTTLSRSAEATVFNRTFTVFDPYEKKTILHRFLPLFMTLPFVGAMLIGVGLLLLASSGLLLALLIVILSLGFIATGESFEAHTESKLLIRAIENGKKLGTGDIRLLDMTKMILSRLTSYYIVLAAFLLALAAAFPMFWSSILLFLTAGIGLIIQISTVLGPAGAFIGLILYGCFITILLVGVVAAKNRLFGYHVDPSSIRQKSSFWNRFNRNSVRASEPSSKRGKPDNK